MKVYKYNLCSIPSFMEVLAKYTPEAETAKLVITMDDFHMDVYDAMAVYDLLSVGFASTTENIEINYRMPSTFLSLLAGAAIEPKNRFISKNAFIIWHELVSFGFGTYSALKNRAEEGEVVYTRIKEILIANYDITPDLIDEYTSSEKMSKSSDIQKLGFEELTVVRVATVPKEDKLKQGDDDDE